MNFAVDAKFAGLATLRGRNGKQVSKTVWNLSCPYCGDSKRKKTKARGFFTIYSNFTGYYCHNCGISTTLRNYLRQHEPDLYRQYLLELLIEQAEQPADLHNITNASNSVTLPGESAHLLLDSHPALRYLSSRFITDPCKLRRLRVTEDKIIFPICNELGHIIGWQERFIKSSLLRYQTYLIGSGEILLFNSESIDWSANTPVYVTEGAFDALSLDQAVCSFGATRLVGVAKFLRKSLGDRVVCVFDNDIINNRELLKQVKRAISEGLKIIIYPEDFKFKDLNEACGVLDVESYLTEHCYQGLSALIALSNRLKQGGVLAHESKKERRFV